MVCGLDGDVRNFMSCAASHCCGYPALLPIGCTRSQVVIAGIQLGELQLPAGQCLTRLLTGCWLRGVK